MEIRIRPFPGTTGYAVRHAGAVDTGGRTTDA